MTSATRGRRRIWVNATLLLLAGAVFISLVSLGNWQMRRLDWKLGLIEAVELRAFGVPVGVPSGAVDALEHVYLLVGAEGSFRYDLVRQVKAVTDFSPGSRLDDTTPD